jgi:hypothetical protein
MRHLPCSLFIANTALPTILKRPGLDRSDAGWDVSCFCFFAAGCSTASPASTLTGVPTRRSPSEADMLANVLSTRLSSNTFKLSSTIFDRGELLLDINFFYVETQSHCFPSTTRSLAQPKPSCSHPRRMWAVQPLNSPSSDIDGPNIYELHTCYDYE